MADQVTLPVVDELEVTQELYETSYVLLTLEGLKDKGIVEGGFYVDSGKLKEIETAGKAFGYIPPSLERVEEIMEGILMFPYAEEDDEAEVQN